MDRRSGMVTTLAALRSRQGEVATELAELDKRVATLRAEEEDLQAATAALQRLVGEEVGAGDASNGHPSDVMVAAHSPAFTEDGHGTPPSDPGEVIKRDEPPRRKKVRSTQMVKDHLMHVARPQTREEILTFFREAGITTLWKFPENAVNTAILRAVDSGEVRELVDGRVVHVSAPTTIPPSSPVNGAPSRTEEQ